MTITYKFEITPLESLTAYGSAVDITEYVDFSSMPVIRKEIDQGDFEVGVFNFGSFNFTANNETGKFNEPQFDGRSIFPLKRDKSIVEITFTDSDDVEIANYKGLITDIASSQDLDNRKIGFTALGYDSIFNKVDVAPGSILSGHTFSEAFRVLLSNAKITNLLNYSDSNINPSLDLVIDNGAVFNTMTVKEAIDLLLNASSSILLIDNSDNMIVRSRAANSNTPHELFLNDQFRRDNILKLNSFNNGLQRLVNSVVVGEAKARDKESINLYDTNQQGFAFEFITTLSKKEQIAESILADFGTPRVELMLDIDRETLSDIEILDRVLLDINYHTIPRNLESYPLYEYAEYDKGAEYPHEVSEFRVSPSQVFKIIAIEDDPKKFTINLKLRDTGEII